MGYQEFKLTVPIWDLSDESGERDSADVTALFALLDVTPPRTTLDDLYDSFFDSSAVRGYPYGRIGRGDLCMFLSNTNDETFIAFDMFNEATDQMNGVSIQVRAPERHADEIRRLMQSIRTGAEAASALLHGDLGLQAELALGNFPRRVKNHDAEVLQDVQVFKDGQLLHSSKAT